MNLSCECMINSIHTHDCIHFVVKYSGCVALKLEYTNFK